MKGFVYSIGFILVFSSCGEENLTPDAFLDYEYPTYENMHSDKLEELNRDIKSGNFGAIHSLIILRNDKIIFENYYSNYQRSDLHPIGSSTQSVISTLTGIALAADSTLSLNAKIIEFFPEYGAYFNNIPQKDQIEIRHLMTNTSGLWWDELSYPFGNEENDAYKMSISDDWISTVLSTPMIREPGYEFNYNSGNGILMAPIIEQLTGQELEQFARDNLFDPLHIDVWKWERIPNGQVNASWGLSLRPMDMAKIGYLYLKNGSWGDQRLFDESWSTRSTRIRTNISNAFNFGYFWWRFTDYSELRPALLKNDVYFSWGDGGQFIFVIPHLDVVVVSTAEIYLNNDVKTFEILKNYVVDSILDRFL